MGRMTRRVVLGSGVAMVGAVGLSAWACGRAGQTSARAWQPERLQVARSGVPDADRIGDALHRQIGAPGVAAAIGTIPALVQAMAEPCPATRAAAIDAQIRREHSSGDIVVVARWVVARSEALIAAAT